MKRHDLPGGGWADLRNEEEMTQRGRRGVRALSGALGDSTLRRLRAVTNGDEYEALHLDEHQLDLIIRMQEATVVALLAGWSFPEELPTMASVGDLPVARYDALVGIVAAAAANIATMDLDVSPQEVVDGTSPTGA
jgi:hypothetical protein